METLAKNIEIKTSFPVVVALFQEEFLRLKELETASVQEQESARQEIGRAYHAGEITESERHNRLNALRLEVENKGCIWQSYLPCDETLAATLAGKGAFDDLPICDDVEQFRQVTGACRLGTAAFFRDHKAEVRDRTITVGVMRNDRNHSGGDWAVSYVQGLWCYTEAGRAEYAEYLRDPRGPLTSEEAGIIKKLEKKADGKLQAEIESLSRKARQEQQILSGMLTAIDLLQAQANASKKRQEDLTAERQALKDEARRVKLCGARATNFVGPLPARAPAAYMREDGETIVMGDDGTWRTEARHVHYFRTYY